MKDIRRSIDKYLKLLKNGDECFDKLFKISYPYVKYIAYMYVFDKSFTDDVILNAYMSVLRSVQSFDDSKNGYAWLCKITKNEAYKINSRECRPETELDESVECLIDDKDFMDNLITKYDIEKAIESLDETDRKIVDMKIYKFMTFEAIAAELNISAATVFYRLNKTLKEIQKNLTNN